MKIYTKKGDKGETCLANGERRLKSDLRVVAYGDLDELQAILGLAFLEMDSSVFADMRSIIERIQNQVFVLSGNLAGAARTDENIAISSTEIQWLESCIDGLDKELPELRNFILPGGSRLAVHLHHARAVTRRVERSVVALNKKEEVDPEVVAYLNRLSDLLFVMARVANHRLGIAERIWDSKGSNQTRQKV